MTSKTVLKKRAKKAVASRVANFKSDQIYVMLISKDFGYGPKIDRDTPICALQALADQIWSMEKPRHRLPDVVAGDGIYLDVVRGSDSGGRVSFQRGDRIELCRAQRTPLVLVHELAHAMVRTGLDHGKAWREKFYYLLVKYLKVRRCDMNNIRSWVELKNTVPSSRVPKRL